MRLLAISALIFVVVGALAAEEIPLKLNQKDVEVARDKIEKYFVLFPVPPADIVIKGPAKMVISVRKVIDRKNPLTKLPVRVTIEVDGKKEKEITLNDREGSAVIKDATMYNAGQKSVVEYDLKEGEHKIRLSVSKSAVKGVLLRVDKKVEEKMADASTHSVAKPAEVQKEKAGAKGPAEPFVPPLVPLVSPSEAKGTASIPTPPATPVAKPVEDTKKRPESKEPDSPAVLSKGALTKIQPKTTQSLQVERRAEEPSIKGEVKTAAHRKGFGDIVILSIKGGVLLPLQYGNPGGYGEFNTYFNLYRGIGVGAFIGTYNVNRDYLVNDPKTGNAIAKYHLHSVPIMGFIGYRFQMQSILTKLEITSGVNMNDLELRRDGTPTKMDTINSLAVGMGAEIDYIIKKYGSLGMGIRYIYSNSGNIDKVGGFIKDADTGGLILSLNYLYGF